MSGILDNKSRVLDTVITTEGKRQLALGGIDIKFVSFTDNATFYKADLVSGSQDATQRVYLEACQLPQDDIVFRADDDGNLQTFRNSDNIPLAGGRILEYSFAALTASTLTGSTQTVKPLQGDAFADKAQAILGSSAQNFKKLQLIATKDKVFEDDGFALGPNNVQFIIHDNRPISNPSQHSTHVSALDSIFSDPRFSNQQNFKYLPPVNKFSDKTLNRGDPRMTRNYYLGWYQPWGRTHVMGMGYKSVMSELQYYRHLGYEQVINFDPTSRENRLVGQFFERSYDTLRKLDVVDYGSYPTGNAAAPVAQIFFVGKVEVDEKGTDTFIHLFTLVFE